MKESHFRKLLKKYISGEISPLEESVLEQFDHELLGKRKIEHRLDKEKASARLVSAISKRKTQKSYRNGIFRIAAVIITAIGLTFYFTYFSSKNTIDPIVWIEYTTNKGEQMTVTLSDGSIVQLNASSCLSFPQNFQSYTQREVILSGEAYFQVKRNPKKAFIVSSGPIYTKVLGTSFNIRYYEGEPATVSVESGKVNVSANQNLKNVDLYQDEEVLFYQDSLIKQNIVFKEQTIWHNNRLEIENASIDELLGKIEKWYGVSFQYKPSDFKGEKYRISFKKRKLNNVLEELSSLICADLETIQPSKLIRLKKVDCNPKNK